MMYQAQFDVSSGFGTLTLSHGSHTSLVITVSTLTQTTYDGSATTSLHVHLGGIAQVDGEDPDTTGRLIDTWGGSSFSVILQVALRAAAVSAGSWSSTDIDVTHSVTTGAYTIDYSDAADGNIGFTGSTAATRTLLGFSGAQTGAATYTSDVTPDYIVIPTLDAVSAVGSADAANYEAEPSASASSTDEGRQFGITRTTAPISRDWVQQFEVKAKTMRLNAASTHPWTFQKLFEHCRTDKIFVVVTGFGEDRDEVFMFRTEGSRWDPERATPGNDSAFHIPFMCNVIGKVEQGG